MENDVKTWIVTYKHPSTGETVNGIEYAKTKKQAVKQARKHNTPTQGNSFFWEIVSVEEQDMGGFV